MRVKIKLLIVQLFLLLMCAVLPPTQAQDQSRQLEARKAVERFYRHFSRHEYNRMWDMLSQAVKDGNNNSKTTYVREVSRARSIIIEIEIESVKIDGPRATVVLLKRLRHNASAESYLEKHEEIWVKQKGKWLFDSSRMLTEVSESNYRPESSLSKFTSVAASELQSLNCIGLPFSTNHPLWV